MTKTCWLTIFKAVYTRNRTYQIGYTGIGKTNCIMPIQPKFCVGHRLPAWPRSARMRYMYAFYSVLHVSCRRL